MRSKKSIYLLIAILLIVWGIIVKKIFFTSPQSAMTVTLSERQKSIEADVSDELVLDYPDPFLKNYQSTAPSVSQPTVTSLPKNNSAKAKIPNPDIVFIGKISLGKKSVYLFEMAKMQYDMQLGDEVNGFKLIRIYPDSVHFKSDETIFCIKKQS